VWVVLGQEAGVQADVSVLDAPALGHGGVLHGRPYTLLSQVSAAWCSSTPFLSAAAMHGLQGTLHGHLNACLHRAQLPRTGVHMAARAAC
jgi:hypothetical protein